ncbi:MAG: Na+/H+ antiporter NhaC family protein [Phycisphaerae bacterium]
MLILACCAAAWTAPQDPTTHPTAFRIRPVEKTGAPIDTSATTSAPVAQSEPRAAVPAAAASRPVGGTVSPAEYYGLWVIVPALVAIVIAIATRQVLVALPIGIFTASAMMLSMQGVYNPIRWFTYTIDHYLFGVLAVPAEDGSGVDYGNLQILSFTLFIGAMVGIIEANGGTRAMVARVTRHMKNRNRGQLGAWFAGILVFFDDYANAMIVGPSMRPVFDRLRLSREKLAYIVDSTAAPVASVLIGTWLVTEISYIDKGLDALGADRPAFLAGMTGSTAFWASLPYRTYAWLALVMVFLIAVTGRDFGSMRRAEARALREKAPAGAALEAGPADGRRWWLAAAPVAFLVLMTVVLLVTSGWRGYVAEGGTVGFGTWAAATTSLNGIMGAADSYAALLYASLCSTLLAILLTLGSRSISLGKTMDAVSSGMSRMFAACVVLILAWGLSQGGKDLQLGLVAGDHLKRLEESNVFSTSFLPLATFITAAIVSFATGTSWGTMGILCPAAVAIAARLFSDMPEDHALTLFYATIGAVLTGSVFGDHCSPISDTTVLSSIASECELGAHVWTQMPYALVVAFVGILCTDFLYCGLERWAHGFFVGNERLIVYLGTAAGALVLWAILRIVGRRPALSGAGGPPMPSVPPTA